MLESLNATTESAKHKYDAIQENGIKSTTQTYILTGVAVIVVLGFFVIPSYWLYRKNNLQRGRRRRLDIAIVVIASANMGY